MMDIVDNESRQRGVERNDWAFWDDLRQEPWTPLAEQKMATAARWGRAILTIGAISSLCWTVVDLL